MTKALQSSLSNEWYTPLSLIEKVRMVLGEIDLDPASTLEVNRDIKASRIFTKENNGLAKRWDGKTVFCNPPGGKLNGKSLQEVFFMKMYSEWKLKHFDAGVMLCFNSAIIHSKSQAELLSLPVCFSRGRIKFEKIINGNREAIKNPTHGNLIVLFPANESQVSLFREQFKDVGIVSPQH